MSIHVNQISHYSEKLNVSQVDIVFHEEKNQDLAREIRLAKIKSRIKNGYYNGDDVLKDISDKLGSILADYDH